MDSVVLPWVAEMPLKKQSALFAALRGPDVAFCPHTKRLTKFLRSIAQKNADPSTDYMREKPIDVKELERELEFLPLHYVAHLVEALYLITKWGPPKGRHTAWQWLLWFEGTFHLSYVETPRAARRSEGAGRHPVADAAD